METILVMLSGGLDSVYMLYYYLTQTEHPLHVHHISLRYPQFRRWVLEDPAVKKIVANCREHYRPFDYSESRFDMEPLNEVGMDSDLQLLVGSKLALNLPGDMVTLALGHNYDDDPLESMQQESGPTLLLKLWWAMHDRMRLRERISRNYVKPLQEMKLTKEEICKRLPEDLLRLCWSCRAPDFRGETALPCGTCTTCLSIEKIFKEMGRAEAFPNLVRPASLSRSLDRHRLPHPLSDPPTAGGQSTNASFNGPTDTGPRPADPSAMPVFQGMEASTPVSQCANLRPREKVYSPRFKAQVALEALRNGQSSQQLSARFGIGADLVEEWRNALLKGADVVFGSRETPRSTIEARVDDLFRQINELREQVQRRSLA